MRPDSIYSLCGLQFSDGVTISWSRSGKPAAPLNRKEISTVADMKVTLSKDKTKVTIELPYASKADAAPSASGKSLTRATTRGNQAVSLDGEVVKVGVNMFTMLN